MPKLHLKETPEERAARKWRKAQKAERKARRTAHLHRQATDEEPPRKRPHTEDDDDVLRASSSKVDTDQIRAEVEERMFREKLFDAMQDDYDHRLDGVEARFNDYGHVPDRWKTAGGAHLDDRSVRPEEMLDDEYAEWVREGMWRRTHKAEVEARARRKAERKARKEGERKAAEETARLEREREGERRRKREYKERRQLREAWGYYEARWKAHAGGAAQDAPLRFADVPWPVFAVARTPEDLTAEGISGFLLHDVLDEMAGPRTRRERVREALLRWHPDKFEGKMGSRLDAREKETVMEGVGIVARCLNAMMAG